LIDTDEGTRKSALMISTASEILLGMSRNNNI